LLVSRLIQQYLTDDNKAHQKVRLALTAIGLAPAVA
jgi:hypothetical protein